MREEELKFVVTVAGEERVYDLGEAVIIDEENLNEAFTQQPALLAWWGALYENALDRFRRADLEFDTYMAALYEVAREELVQEGGRVTEGKVDARVKSGTEYLDARTALLKAKHRAEMLRVAVKALEEKGRMLQSLGAHRRAEMELTVR